MSAESVSLHYEVHDGVPGPFVFMVHGMLSSRRQWDSNLEAVSRIGRPVVFDLWGHGRSPAPRDEALYRVEALHEQFERVRERLGAPRILLCGQSFGAGLTIGYSVRHPSRVIAQAFTNSVSALSPPTRFEVSGERQAWVEALEQGGEAGREALRRLPIHPARARRLEPAIREVLCREADAADPQGIARLMRYTSPQVSVIGMLEAVACPTLLVNGALEKGFQPHRERLPGVLGDCRIVDLPAGHAVNIEAAAGFNEALVAFFGEALSRAPQGPDPMRA
jgi:2-succinyl-6-hydroxy-2,4-cyclohexadiene-1-carboxylate synthase